jgi:hypothetical protein
MPEVKGQSGNSDRRYETQDVAARSMLYSAIGIAALTLAGLLASWFSFKYFVGVQQLGPPASPFENTRELPPAPRLQVSPAQTLKQYQSEENSRLNSYGWIDKNPGVVRIPIERAMQLSLQRGFPTRLITPTSNRPVGEKEPMPAPSEATSLLGSPAQP